MIRSAPARLSMVNSSASGRKSRRPVAGSSGARRMYSPETETRPRPAPQVLVLRHAEDGSHLPVPLRLAQSSGFEFGVIKVVGVWIAAEGVPPRLGGEALGEAPCPV